jgi:hypothetical protein
MTNWLAYGSFVMNGSLYYLGSIEFNVFSFYKIDASTLNITDIVDLSWVINEPTDVLLWKDTILCITDDYLVQIQTSNWTLRTFLMNGLYHFSVLKTVVSLTTCISY